MLRRQTSRLVLAAAIAAAALLTSAPLAAAATANGPPQFAVTAGTLVFGTAPDVPNLPALTLNGQAQTLNGQMASYSMSDGTGSGSGWNGRRPGQTTGGKRPG